MSSRGLLSRRKKKKPPASCNRPEGVANPVTRSRHMKRSSKSARTLTVIASRLGWNLSTTRAAAQDIGGEAELASFVATWDARCRKAWEERRGLLRRVEESKAPRDVILTRLYWTTRTRRLAA